MWEKIFANGFKVRFRGIDKNPMTTPTTLVKKNFTRSLQFAKFAKIFSHANFPLYGYIHVQYFMTIYYLKSALGCLMVP